MNNLFCIYDASVQRLFYYSSPEFLHKQVFFRKVSSSNGLITPDKLVSTVLYRNEIDFVTWYTHAKIDYKKKSMDVNICKLLNRELGGAVLSSLWLSCVLKYGLRTSGYYFTKNKFSS